MKAIGKRQFNDFAAHARLHAQIHGVQLEMNTPSEYEGPSNWTAEDEKLAAEALAQAQARRMRAHG